MKPNEEFMGFMQKMEDLFLKLNGNELALCNPIERFTKILKENFPDAPQSLLYFVSKVRFFIRLKYLNSKLDKEIECRKRYNNHINKYM